MTDSSPQPSERKPLNRGAAAGMLGISTLLLCAAVGFGVGAAVGAAVPFGLAGVFIGFAAGFAVVYLRFKDL
jgi:hypothetical protein